MNDHMMHWTGSELVLTPNKCNEKRTVRVMALGFLSVLLSVYLALRFHNFWQLPLAIGASSAGLAGFYKYFSADMELTIPKGIGEITFRFGFSSKKQIMKKDEALIVRNTLNGNPYYAIANKQNPYGKSYQISPFLTKKKRTAEFEENILPIIAQQLAN